MSCPHYTDLTPDTCLSQRYEGYGLAYGGIGAYTACNECEWFSKMQDEEPAAPPEPTKETTR